MTSESRNRRIAQMLERSQSLLQNCNVVQNCKMGILQDHGSHTPLQDEGEEPMMDLASSLQTRYEHTNRNRELSVSIVNIETGAQTE